MYIIYFPPYRQRWLPVLDRVGAPLPLECPLHPQRDLFADQESHKSHRHPHWLCAYCGKAFLQETDLDRHLGARHADRLNEVTGVMHADRLNEVTCFMHADRLNGVTGAGTPTG